MWKCALTHLACKCKLLTGYKGYTITNNMRMDLMCEISDNTQQHQKVQNCYKREKPQSEKLKSQ